jgi:hypothetical protein
LALTENHEAPRRHRRHVGRCRVADAEALHERGERGGLLSASALNARDAVEVVYGAIRRRREGLGEDRRVGHDQVPGRDCSALAVGAMRQNLPGVARKDDLKAAPEVAAIPAALRDAARRAVG